MGAKTVFDITEFGAVGDGSADSTAAIQKALDAAAACCGTVVVPPGTYLSGMLRLGAGVSLEGHSAWSFRSFGASTIVLADPKAACLLDITGAFGCSIRGMSLDGGKLGEGIHGVRLQWPEYNGGGEEDTPTIDDCRIGRFTGDGLHYGHVWCFSVRHSMICSNGGAGLFIDGWDGFVIDNWFSGNRGCGMAGGACCASVTATGNRIEWNGVAGVSMPNVNCCNFTGNYFDRSFGPGLVLGGAGRASAVSVSGNVFYRSGKPMERPFAEKWDSSHVRLTNAEDIAVTGNTFRIGRDDGGKGVWSPEYVAVLKDCEKCVFSANTWNRGGLADGIVLLGRNDDVAMDGNVGATATPAP